MFCFMESSLFSLRTMHYGLMAPLSAESPIIGARLSRPSLKGSPEWAGFPSQVETPLGKHLVWSSDRFGLDDDHMSMTSSLPLPPSCLEAHENRSQSKMPRND